LDKAPDAFRTISEVADDLDVPQHVLRFWETRFSQIKPMKRSGGRRYYRPDDVDLLRGIRHLLYGEGYTIRGVQRILKEQGVKSVQRLADGAPIGQHGGAQDRGSGHEPPEDIPADDEDDVDLEADIADEETGEGAEPAIQVRREPVLRPAGRAEPSFAAGPPAVPTKQAPTLDIGRLREALSDLVACRELLEAVFADGKESPPAPIEPDI
jgi:DNA-binding transcriptional MerR regulator